MANMHSSASFYKTTQIKDFYLDLWEGDVAEVPATYDDEEYTIESKYHRRPDLLAYDRYGDPALWWKLAMRNKDLLVDPINDFQSGLIIWIPPAVGKT